MVQTFADLLRERAREGRGVFVLALWMGAETFLGIIRENLTFIIMFNKRIVFIVLAVAGILLVPLIAMQFTSEVNWTLGDFVVAGALLLGTGLSFELAMRRTGNAAYRAGAFLALGTTLLLVWVNLAVGIIGNENNSLNLLYFGALAGGIVGAFIARFRAEGMVRAMAATAAALALVPVAALMVGRPSVASAEDLMGVAGVFVLSGFFAALFAGSAFLFRRAAASSAALNPRFE